MLDDSELALDGSVWIAQALRAKWTISAGGDRRFEVSNAVAVEEHVFAALVQLVTGRADTLRLALVVGEICQRKQTALLVSAHLTLFAPQQRAIFLGPLLVSGRVSKC